MAALTPGDVKRMAETIGLTIDDDDLSDVTARLNATLDRLAALARHESSGENRGGGEAP